MIFLEKKLRRRNDLVEIIRDGIDTAADQVAFFDTTHGNVLANLAGIYQSSISTLSPRIMVTGTPAFLNNSDNTNKIRALLLAGIRATVLRRRLGGSRLQLLFGAKAIADTAHDVLAKLEA